MKRIYALFIISTLLTGCQAAMDPFFSTQNNSNNNPPQTGTTLEPLTTLRFGDRTYVASVLTNIFVPATTGLTTPQLNERQLLVDKVNALVTLQYSNFGRSCDYFNSSTESCSGTGTTTFGTYNDSNTNLTSFALSTPLRSALSLRSVYGLIWFRTEEIALKTAIANVRTIIEGSPVAISSIVPTSLSLPTEDEVSAAFQLVYRGVEPSPATLQALMNLVSESYNSLASQTYPVQQSNGRIRDVWRFLFISLLASSIWQAP